MRTRGKPARGPRRNIYITVARLPLGLGGPRQRTARLGTAAPPPLGASAPMRPHHNGHQPASGSCCPVVSGAGESAHAYHSLTAAVQEASASLSAGGCGTRPSPRAFRLISRKATTEMATFRAPFISALRAREPLDSAQRRCRRRAKNRRLSTKIFKISSVGYTGVRDDRPTPAGSKTDCTNLVLALL